MKPLRTHIQTPLLSRWPIALAASVLLALSSGRAFADFTEMPENNERYISIQMDRVPGARYYEVEVQRWEKRDLEPGQKFQIYDDDPNVFARLRPGKWGARTRSLIDITAQPGPWGEWAEFNVAFKKVDSLYPTEGEKLTPKTKENERIFFRWPAIEDAKGYFFMLKQDGRILDIHKADRNFTDAYILPDQKYEWAIVPITGDENTYNIDWSSVRSHRFEVLSFSDRGKTVTIDVVGDPRSVKYQFELVKFTSYNMPSPPSIYDSKDTRFRAKLAPGLYELRVRSILGNGNITEWSRPERFYVKFPYPQLIAPANKKVIEPDDNWHNKIELKWESLRDTNKYYVRVLDKTTRNIIDLKEVHQNSVVIDVEHEHEYQWSVIGLSYGERIDAVMIQNAPTFEFKIPYYIKLQMTSSEEVSHFYGWYRHWISNIAYVGKNYDQNSLYNQTIFGGTGEAAVGYWSRKTRWGVLADGSLSGFIINGNYYNYTSGGLNLGRRVFLSDFTRIRYWLGISYTEFPDFVVSPYDTTQVSYTRVQTMGPQAQISYMAELSEEMGYHIYFHTFYPMAAVRTPNGNQFIPGPSLRFGLLGTWQYTDDVKMQLGYSYRFESYGYESWDKVYGTRNSSQYGGHFLNFAVEFGLSKKKYK